MDFGNLSLNQKLTLKFSAKIIGHPNLPLKIYFQNTVFPYERVSKISLVDIKDAESSYSVVFQPI